MSNSKQRANLKKLADYLDTLPPDYKHFDMTYYTDHEGNCDLEDIDELASKRPQEFLANCGTVACAIGHGPAAGIRRYRTDIDCDGDFDWDEYSERVFGCISDNEVFEYLFDSNWCHNDNTHYGAAARIRYYLENGVPKKGFRVNYDTSIYERYRKDAVSSLA
jgi:hypothetical protein